MPVCSSQGRSMVSSEADEFSPGEKEEYERLLSERALLEHVCLSNACGSSCLLWRMFAVLQCWGPTQS
jgi:hypothetical protein